MILYGMLRMGDCRVLVKTSVPRREAIREDWRRFNIAAPKLYFSTNIIDSVELFECKMIHKRYNTKKLA
jgi:hypothetical protein